MLCVGMGLSVAGYLAVHAMLRSDELDVFVGMVKRKFGRSAKKAGALVNMSHKASFRTAWGRMEMTTSEKA